MPCRNQQLHGEVHDGGLFSEVVHVSKQDFETMIRDKRLRIMKNGDPAEVKLSDGGITNISNVSRSYVNEGTCAPGNTLYNTNNL